MADQNSVPLNIEVKVEAAALKKAFDEVVGTTTDFYHKMIVLDEEYHQIIKKNLTGQVKHRKELFKVNAALAKQGTTAKKEAKKNVGPAALTQMSPMEAVNAHKEQLRAAGKARRLSGKKIAVAAPWEEERKARDKKRSDEAKASAANKLIQDRDWKQRKAGGFGMVPLAQSVGQSIGGNRLRQSPVAKAGAGVIDKTVGASISNFGKKLSDIGESGEGLTKIFSGLGGIVQKLSGYIGTTVATVLTVLYEATQAKKEFAKRMTVGVGGTGGGDIDSMSRAALTYGISQHPVMGGSDALKMTMKESSELMNTLDQSGVSVKNLAGGYADLKKATDTAAQAAINLGLTFEQGGKLVGEFYDRTGAGVNKMNKIFANLTQDIKSSGMTTNAFLSTMQSVSAQFSIFLDQTLTFSKLLKGLSTSGLSQKQAGVLTQALGGFGAQNFEEGNTRAAYVGKKIYQESVNKQIGELNDQKKDLVGKADPDSIKKLTQIEYRLRSLKAAADNTEVMGDAMMDMPTTKQMQMFFDKDNVKSSGDISKMAKDTKKIRILGSVWKKSDKETRNILDAIGTYTQQQVDQDKSSDSEDVKFQRAMQGLNEDQLETISNEAANREEAQKLQNATTASLRGAPEIANTILIAIADILTEIYNDVSPFIAKMLGQPEVTPKSLGDRIKDIMSYEFDGLVKDFKDSSKKKVRTQDDLDKELAAQRYLSGGTNKAGVTAKGAIPLGTFKPGDVPSGKKSAAQVRGEITPADKAMADMLKRQAEIAESAKKAEDFLKTVAKWAEIGAVVWAAGQFISLIGTLTSIVSGITGAAKWLGLISESAAAIETAVPAVTTAVATAEGGIVAALAGGAAMAGAGAVGGGVGYLAGQGINWGADKMSGGKWSDWKNKMWYGDKDAEDAKAMQSAEQSGQHDHAWYAARNHPADAPLMDKGGAQGAPTTPGAGGAGADPSLGNKVVYLMVEGKMMRAYIKEVVADPTPK